MIEQKRKNPLRILPIMDSFGWVKNHKYGWQNGTLPHGAPPSKIIYARSLIDSGLEMTYTYDQDLRLTQKDVKWTKTEDYTYDTNGVLNTMSYSFPDVWVNPVQGELNFTRDNSGLITAVTGDKQMNITYNNDLEIGNIQHTLPQSFAEAYTYDTRGNRLTSPTQSSVYNNLNQLIENSTHTYQYDADGNLIEEKNKATTETRKYYFNSQDRLIKYEHYPTDAALLDVTAEYKYDLHGRRIQKSVNGVITNFVWEQNNLSLELDSSNQPIRKYFYNVAMDDVECHLEYTEVTHWTNVFEYPQGWYYYVKDQVGTIYKVVDVVNEQFVEERSYDSFGNLVNSSGTATTNLGFQGKYYDQESGLYYFYNRYYNPLNGRFINEDPIGFQDDLNMYKFVANNPINSTDPLGLFCLGNEEIMTGLAVGPVSAAIAYGLSRKAIDVAEAMGLPGNGWMSAQDAFRHCYWTCLMTRTIGPVHADWIGYIHEECDENNTCDQRRMDEHNNAMGIILGFSSCSGCKESCLWAWTMGMLVQLF